MKTIDLDKIDGAVELNPDGSITGHSSGDRLGTDIFRACIHDEILLISVTRPDGWTIVFEGKIQKGTISRLPNGDFRIDFTIIREVVH